MSDDERTSPRAAIKQWLIDTNDRTKRSTNRRDVHNRRHKHDSHSRPRDQKGIHQSRKDPPDHDRRRQSRQEEIFPAKNISKIDHSTSHPQSTRPPMLQCTYQDLSSRLDLQASIRNYKRDDAPQSMAESFHRPRKRWRSSSLQSSYLQPTTTVELTGLSVDQCFDGKDYGKQASNAKPARINAVSQSATDSSTTPPIPARPAKSYERRARHKTREDRYEIKDDRKGRNATRSKDCSKRKSKKRKCNEKTGAALMHDFTAQNVSRDRLTVRSINKTYHYLPC